MVDIFIENIIASADMGGDLDLEGILKQFPNCEYNPSVFPGVVFRPNEPKVVMLFFNDGKIMVTAAKSVDDVENSINMAEKELKEKGLILPPGTKREAPSEPAIEPAEVPIEPPEEAHAEEPVPEVPEEGTAEAEPTPEEPPVEEPTEEPMEDEQSEEPQPEDGPTEEPQPEDEPSEEPQPEEAPSGKKKKKKKKK